MIIFGYLKDIAIVACIASLLVVGVTIALKSGIVAVGPDRSRLLLANLSQLVITLSGCLLAFGIVQELIGIRLTSAW